MASPQEDASSRPSDTLAQSDTVPPVLTTSSTPIPPSEATQEPISSNRMQNQPEPNVTTSSDPAQNLPDEQHRLQDASHRTPSPQNAPRSTQGTSIQDTPSVDEVQTAHSASAMSTHSHQDNKGKGEATSFSSQEDAQNASHTDTDASKRRSATQAVDTTTVGNDTSSAGPGQPAIPPAPDAANPTAVASPAPSPKPPTDGANPTITITLLLSSGPRHPFYIDVRYLKAQNVDIPEQTDDGLDDPLSISVYTLKELILREWRAEWEAKPLSPSSIRLIHFGKLLDDKEKLKEYRFDRSGLNVIHMSIKPQHLVDKEEQPSGDKPLPRSRRRRFDCCVIL